MDTVCFGLAERYDTGRETGVAMEGDTVVEVHKSENADDLWYRVGRAGLGRVEWSGARKYDTGITPAVGIGGGKVVEVHRSENRGRLFYSVGTVRDGRIDWSKADDYDDGDTPGVAVNAAGLVVEVHASYDDPLNVREKRLFELWYHVGRIDGSKVKWGKSRRYTTGLHPAVALMNDGTVIEMHESETTDQLYLRTGTVSGEEIQWGESKKYQPGRAPALACESSTRQVVEVHELPNRSEETPYATLVSATAKLDGALVWDDDPQSFDTGWNPAVGYSGLTAVQTHSGNDRRELWSSLSLVIDRKEWMRARQETLDLRKLWQIAMPATHDSGAYNLGTDRVPEACRDMKEDVPAVFIEPYATAQSRDMAAQLARGVRYFDIRLVPDGDDSRAYHDLKGPNFSTMLDQTVKFFRSVSRELVIFKIQRFCQFTDEDHKNVIGRITEKLGDFLYVTDPAPSGEDLLKLPFKTLTERGPRVLIHYRSDYISANPAPGFWRSIPTYDETSDTNSYDDMRSDQTEKLKNNQGTPEGLFLLSWTLTPSNSNIAKSESLYQLSRRPNRNLGSFCAEYAPKFNINFLYVDFFEDARATDIAVQMNDLPPSVL